MEIFFILLSLIIILSAILVVVLRNPVYSSLSLIVSMLGVAGVFAMLDAHFLAAVQIIVYAGAIIVLVLFVLMLLNIKEEEAKSTIVIPAIFSLLTAFGFLIVFLPNILDAFSMASTSDMLQNAFGEKSIHGTVKDIGKLLYTKYLFPFEIASVLIMAALIGAVMLGKTKYKD